jgi:2-polyprenyl-3-methyl-5-hydroxy-6-metoxy-1,4-benzoquinol methylase
VNCPLCASEEKAFVESWIDEEIGQEYTLYACRRCTLVYADPMRAATPSHYEGGETYKDRWEFHRTLDLLGREKKKILEIGCGEGMFLQHALRRGHDCVGLDFNERAVEHARQSLKHERVYAMTLEEFAERFPEERFDVICFFHVLEHVERPLSFLEQTRARLRAGGMLCIAVPNENRFTLQHVSREPWDYPAHHLTRWTRVSLQTLLQRAGMELVVMEDHPLRMTAILDMLMGMTSLGILRKHRGKSSSSGQRTEQNIPPILNFFVKVKRLLLLPAAVMVYGLDKLRGRTGESLLIIARAQTGER